MKLSNNTYDKLKKIALYVLPAIATLILGLGKVWNIPISDQVVQTISLFITFIDTILGVGLHISSNNYWEEYKEEEEQV